VSHLAIRAKGLGKHYVLGARQKPYHTLRESLTDAAKIPWRLVRDAVLGRPGASAGPSVWALRDVDLEIGRGEAVGIIGRNGAGKSTLLKILSRITKPSAGHVDLVGRVGSLLEVGTGFHPELTGRENIYLNGAILGMRRREIRRHFDAIVAFAGIEPFIDTPVKHYSSGMYLRLGFAVAAHLETEILLVDEVLAVGDAEFQKRCLGKMNEISRQGRAVLFVSHNLGAISQLCERAVVMDKGRVAYTGSAQDAVRYYLDSVNEVSGHQVTFDPRDDQVMQVLGLRATDTQGRTTASFDIADGMRLRVRYVVRKCVRGTNLALMLHREGTDVLCTFDTDSLPQLLDSRPAGEHECEIVLPMRWLKAGLYTVSVGCGYLNQQRIEFHRDAIAFRIEALSEDTTSRGYSEQRAGVLLGPLAWREPALVGEPTGAHR
jgi:lipopolysaccharide transport system ATP-binding protein